MPATIILPPALPAPTGEETPSDFGPEHMQVDSDDENAHAPHPPTITVPAGKKHHANDDEPVPEWIEDLSWNQRLGQLFEPKAIKRSWSASQLIDAIRETGLVVPRKGPGFKTKAHYIAYLNEAYAVAKESVESSESSEGDNAEPEVPLSALYPGSDKRKSSSSLASDSQAGPDDAELTIPTDLPPNSRSTSRSTKRSRSPERQC